jgi:hypothetical protein
VRDEQTKTDSDTEKTMILWARAEDHEDRDSEDANEVGGHGMTGRNGNKAGWTPRVAEVESELGCHEVLRKEKAA